MTAKNFDVIIVGGAYNGLALANILAAYNVKVALIEKRSLVYQKQSNEPSRLLAISNVSVKILHDAGVDNISKIGGSINSIYVCDDDSEADLEFTPKQIGLKNFGYMVEEHELLKALYVAKNPKVSLFENVANLDIDKTSITIDGKTKLTCSLLVGADGKNSVVRQSCFIETIDHNYHQVAFVFDIKHQKSHSGLAIEKFKPNGPVALLPKKEKHESCVVWTIPSNMQTTVNNLGNDEIKELLTDDICQFFGDFSIISEVKSFPLVMRQAKEFFADNTVLIGDALHSIHPLAGQGLNLGLRDVDTLAKLIIKNKNLGLPINSQVLLEQYQNERKSDVNMMIQATHNLNFIFSNQFLPLKVLRRFGLKVINKIPVLKSVFMRYAVGSMEFQNSSHTNEANN